MKDATLSKKGTIIGIVVAVVAVAGILTYTNLFELAKPSIESGIDAGKEVVSKVEGEDVVKGAEIVSDRIKNVTEQIEIKNPLEP